MGKVTKVFNDTKAVIELKQGSANVFLSLQSLPEGKTYNIKVDESATYREYWCAVQPVQSGSTTSVERVVFSSDDCAEFSKVRIYKDKDKYTWEGTEKRGAWRNTQVPAAPKAPVQETNVANPATNRNTQVATPATNPVQETNVPNPVQDVKHATWWQQVTGAFRKKGPT